VAAPAGAGPSVSGPMTYDPRRGRTVLWNGETWEWDGATWNSIVVTTHPAATDGGMAFDMRASKAVLVTRVNGIWEFDGTNWEQAGPSPAPASVFDNNISVSGVTFDQRRGRVLALLNKLVYVLQPTQVPRLCEWDGVSWTYAPLSQPLRIDSPALAYSPELQASLLVAGSDTWLLSGAFPAAVDSIGPACGASTGSQPSLSVIGPGPWVGNDLDLAIQGGPAASVPLLGAIGFSSLQWGSVQLPLDLTFLGANGCSLQVSLDVVESVGTPTWNLSIPDSPAVVGRKAYLQAFKFFPGANPLGLLPTNGLELTVGRL
jgi:hypothetical protein